MKHDENAYLNEPLPPIQRERGNLLVGWLLFLFLANALAVIRGVETQNYLALAWAVFGIVCLLGIWTWHRLALYGLFLGFIFNIMTNIDLGSVQGVMFQVVYIALTYLLIQPKWEFFR